MAEVISAHYVSTGSGSGHVPSLKPLRPRIAFIKSGPTYSVGRKIPGLSLIARPGNSRRASCECALSKEGETILPANGRPEAEQIHSASAIPAQTGTDKSGAKLHDFCLGIPYGGGLVAVGIAGLATAASRLSLGILVLAGVLILSLSTQSLKVWKKGESSLLHIGTQAAVAGAVLGRELYFTSQTKALAIFPSAIVSVLSAVMFVFYSYVYLAGGNPPKKAKLASAVKELA